MRSNAKKESIEICDGFINKVSVQVVRDPEGRQWRHSTPRPVQSKPGPLSVKIKEELCSGHSSSGDVMRIQAAGVSAAGVSAATG